MQDKSFSDAIDGSPSSLYQNSETTKNIKTMIQHN